MTDSKTPRVLESIVLQRKEDIDDLLERAAQRGAERVLAHLGIDNGHAADDIRELRGLLDAWREARRAAWTAVVKAVVTGLLAVALIGIGIKLKLMGGSQ